MRHVASSLHYTETNDSLSNSLACVQRQAVLALGALAPVTLLPAVMGGAERWLDFHASWAHRLPELRHEDGETAHTLDSLTRRDTYVSIVHVPAGQACPFKQARQREPAGPIFWCVVG